MQDKKFNNIYLLHDFLSFNAKLFPDKEAVICEDNRVSYQELELLSNNLANKLISVGMKKSNKVIIYLDNTVETVISIYGILKSGCIFIIVNPLIISNKLKFIIENSETSIIITNYKGYENIKKISNGIVSNLQFIIKDFEYLSLKDNLISWNDAIAERKDSVEIENKFTNIRVVDYDLASLIYTSGSTGEPKGIMCPHKNMISAAKSIITYIKNKPDDKILNVLPLSFDYGLYQVLMTILFAGTIVLEKSFLFPNKILKLLEKEKVTGFPIIPTIASLFIKRASKIIDKYDLSSLRYITSTGSVIHPKQINKLVELFHHVDFYSMYGLTECKRISYLDPTNLTSKPTSVGKAMPNCNVYIIDENGQKVKHGQVGELVVKGSNVMRGYWRDPDLTKSVFRNNPNNFEITLHTGDLFKMDKEGYLYFINRKDDLFKSKGERISPKEIENTICTMKGILDCAIVGIPDNVLGNRINAYIELDNSIAITSNDIKKFCVDNMEAFMIPTLIVILKALPRNTNGKIDKKALYKNR